MVVAGQAEARPTSSGPADRLARYFLPAVEIAAADHLDRRLPAGLARRLVADRGRAGGGLPVRPGPGHPRGDAGQHGLAGPARGPDQGGLCPRAAGRVRHVRLRQDRDADRGQAPSSPAWPRCAGHDEAEVLQPGGGGRAGEPPPAGGRRRRRGARARGSSVAEVSEARLLPGAGVEAMVDRADGESDPGPGRQPPAAGRARPGDRRDRRAAGSRRSTTRARPRCSWPSTERSPA